MYLTTSGMCLKIYGLDSVHFLSAPRLPWQATLKVEFELLVNTDMLLMVENYSSGTMCHAIN